MYVEEAEWAIEVMKATGLPVAMCLNICSAGDFEGVSVEECAVRIAKAGKRWNFFFFFSGPFSAACYFGTIADCCSLFLKCPSKTCCVFFAVVHVFTCKMSFISSSLL